MEHWADRPQQFPICLCESLEWLILGAAGRGKERKEKERRTDTGDKHTEPEKAEE